MQGNPPYECNTKELTIHGSVLSACRSRCWYPLV